MQLIVLAFNPGDPSVVGREKVLVEGGVAGQEKGMLQIAEEAGITRPILDTAAYSPWNRLRWSIP